MEGGRVLLRCDNQEAAAAVNLRPYPVGLSLTDVSWLI